MLVISLSFLTLLSLYFLFVPSGPIFNILALVEFPRYFHYALLIIVSVNAAACLFFEAYCTTYITLLIKTLQRFIRRLQKGEKTRKHGTKMYKAVVAEWQNDGQA
jgi:hypothetical protein